MELINISSFPGVLWHNHLMRQGVKTQVINDLGEIYNVANNYKIDTLYLSVAHINDNVKRCAKEYGFAIKGIYDSHIDTNIDCIGLGSFKTESMAGKKIEVVRTIAPLDPTPPTRNNNKRALLYHYGGNERNYHILQCMDGIDHTYVFGLSSFAYPFGNNCGVIGIHRLMALIQNVGFNICFDPLEIGATPPQIFLSHNLLSLCAADTDATSLAPFPVFNSKQELADLLNYYRNNPEECYKKKVEIAEALNAA